MLLKANLHKSCPLFHKSWYLEKSFVTMGEDNLKRRPLHRAEVTWEPLNNSTPKPALPLNFHLHNPKKMLIKLGWLVTGRVLTDTGTLSSTLYPLEYLSHGRHSVNACVLDKPVICWLSGFCPQSNFLHTSPHQLPSLSELLVGVSYFLKLNKASWGDRNVHVHQSSSLLEISWRNTGESELTDSHFSRLWTSTFRWQL